MSGRRSKNAPFPDEAVAVQAGTDDVVVGLFKGLSSAVPTPAKATAARAAADIEKCIVAAYVVLDTM